MGQMAVVAGDVQHNLERAGEMMAQAGRAQADLVLLPECLDVGWQAPTAQLLAEPIPGPRTEFFAEAATTHGVYVVAGITERAGDAVYNAAIMVSPSGELMLHHRKVNELDIALDLYRTGTQVAVAETGFGRLAVNICADNFPGWLELGHAQGRMGAVALLSPCAWAVPPGHDPVTDPYDEWEAPYRELALAHRMAVVGVSNVGRIGGVPWAGHPCIGCSLAMGPDGRVLARGPYGVDASSLVLVDIPV